MRSLLPALALLALTACPKKAEKRECFDITPAITSEKARAVFERRDCQGGGVTWAALIRVLVNREGTPELATETDWTGNVLAMQGGLLSIDDEGDAARFCSNVPALFERVRKEASHLNADPTALEAAMRETTAEELECEDVGEGEGVAPSPLDPAARQRLEEALARQRTWCWPAASITRWSGQLRFEADGGVSQLELDGGTSSGRWSVASDGRLEASLPSELHHFEVEDGGILSTHFIDGLRADGTAKMVIEPLVPGEGCLKRAQ